MINALIIAAAATLGIVGYSLMARVSFRALLPTLIGGLLGTAVYFLCEHFGMILFVSNLLAALVIALYSEVCARICHAPAIVYMLPGMIILVPGSYLYYTMSNLLSQQYGEAWSYAVMTVQVAAGIADGMICGLIIVSSINSAIRRIREHPRKKKKHTNG